MLCRISYFLLGLLFCVLAYTLLLPFPSGVILKPSSSYAVSKDVGTAEHTTTFNDPAYVLKELAKERAELNKDWKKLEKAVIIVNEAHAEYRKIMKGGDNHAKRPRRGNSRIK